MRILLECVDEYCGDPYFKNGIEWYIQFHSLQGFQHFTVLSITPSPQEYILFDEWNW